MDVLQKKKKKNVSQSYAESTDFQLLLFMKRKNMDTTEYYRAWIIHLFIFLTQQIKIQIFCLDKSIKITGETVNTAKKGKYIIYLTPNHQQNNQF